MKFFVTITERITETRELEVDAGSFEEAHRLAYESWVELGKSGPPSVAVVSRAFDINNEAGEEESFYTEPEEGEGW